MSLNCKLKIGRLLLLCFMLRGMRRHAVLSAIYVILSLPATSVHASETGIPYEVTIKGIDDRKLLNALESVSDAVALRKEKIPATLGLLRRRVDRDADQFLRVLKSEGYYGARVTADINTSTKPVQVTFQVVPGPAYVLRSVDIQMRAEERLPQVEQPDLSEIGLKLGDTLRGRAILDAQDKLLSFFKKRGFAFIQISERRVVVNHEEKSAVVTWLLDLGPPARFGNTHISGLQSVDEVFLRNKIPWKKGYSFNAELLEKAQGQLSATGLFTTVRVTPGQRLEDEGLLPVNIEVTERKHRSIGIGVSYRTDEGPGGRLSWEHRNLLGRGERLNLATAVSEISLSAEGTFYKPGFLRDDQRLGLNLRFADDHTDAYDSRNISSSIFIDRNLQNRITVGAGLAFKFSRVEQEDDKESFSLLSLPLRLDWDTSDKLLDPTRGGRLVLQIAPYQDIEETDLNFVKGRVTATRYLRLLENPSLVLAGRATLGTIRGASQLDIPADERFYAGGGGSIRGYAFQSVGPLDEEDDPVGGRSLLEFSVEPRLKLTDRFGLVGFLDGGSAFASTFPDSSEDLQWAAGLGLRYFTTIGPLRLDVGVPLNPREDVDDNFQIYVSLGQAF